MEQQHATEQNRDQYVRAVERQLQKADREINGLAGQMRSLEGDTRDSIQQKVEHMRSARDRAQEQLDELKSAAENAWQTHRGAVDAALNEMWQAIRPAA